MTRFRWLPVAALCALVTGCGTAPGDRMASGALIGAGSGALVGAAFGGVGVAPGALIGAGVGAAGGGLIRPEDANLGPPIWRR